MLLEVSPDVFDRVQFRSVGRQIERFNLSVQAGEVILNDATTVSGQAIPNEQDRVADLLGEVLHKIAHFLLSHVSFVQSEIELPQCDASSHRQVVPVELVLQDGCHTALGPSANTVRPLAEAALVYEDDDAAFLLGFFLRAGQVFSFQSRMAASFLSRARPTGRWQLQPNFSRKIHHTWPE
jgi:hypothetical protein